MGENQTWEEDWEAADWMVGPPPMDFPPPPPRPPYLEDHVPADGLTTCDLCTWARLQLPPPPRLDAPLEADIDNTLSWTLTLVIVSLLSALLGAVIMVTLLNCRSRTIGAQSSQDNIWCLGRRRRRRTSGSGDGVTDEHNGARGDRSKSSFQMRNSNGDDAGNGAAGNGVWSWITRRSPPTPAIAASVPTIPPVANHYTLDEAYTAVEEALYAELDRPAYQNTGYISDADPVSSAPSSAYYSDLSASDRTYEVPAQTGVWEMVEVPPRRNMPRLAAITETVTVPSDYV